MGNGLISARLEDKYHLQKVKLGEGSFGKVWRGVNKTTGETVAVKQMDKVMLPKRGVKREDIEREVSVMKVVEHKNILRLYDFCEDSQNISFVLEYCDGGDFGDKVKERGNSVTEEEACGWMKQILFSIQALHGKDVCHRDIKPDNFMVSKSNIIKLADFGLAIILPKGKLLTEKCGTPAFMAPEQMDIKKSRGYSHSVDVWAAGITMFMLMTGGKHPFVDSSGKFDEKRLSEGALDFGQGLLAMFGAGGNFSEAARSFCRRMVNPNATSRPSADAALKDQWMSLAVVDRQPPPQSNNNNRAGDQPGGARTPTNAESTPMNAWAQLGGGNFFGLFGDDQNKPPNVQPESEQVVKRRVQDLSSQIDLMKQDPRGMQKENSALKGRIEQLERERGALQQQLEQDQRLKSGYGVGYAAQAATVRESDRNRGLSRRQTDMGMQGRVPQTSVPASSLGGRLPSSLKVRYNSSSAKCWLNATVVSFNDSDGTYDLDLRQHAATNNISPDPTVDASQAWPAGTLVAYHSSSAGRWLDATVVGFVAGSGGVNGTYNLDLRECAEVDRIRPRVGKTSC